MNKSEAGKLVTSLFTQAYDEDQFRHFINNLFHDYTPLNEKASAGQYIPESFRDGIVSFKRLAKFTDPEDMEIDVLAVKVTKSSTLENARTMQRNFIARYLNGLRGGALKEAALVAFYSEESPEWRFSLVRMDYELNEEKQKIEKKLTPARRFSFLVGTAEGTHTAQQQWVPALNSDVEITLTDLETVFNIETVTKEFFAQYKELYLRLTDEIDKVRDSNSGINAHLAMLGVETSDLCKKLLGQIVFLYFLQKKGWLGVEKDKKWGDGDKSFLRSLFDKCAVSDQKYFDDYLEPLFYEGLAEERANSYYQPFDCRIPFLNGGLFEPIMEYHWKDHDFNIPNELFSNQVTTSNGDIGDGIFDVFDRYNFTVREDESLEKEVAVDPEMLGKVFENLLDVKDRKSKGAFYTPREIVHYMCQESLINYLDTTLNTQQRQIETSNQQSLIPDPSKADLLTEYQDVYNAIVPKQDITTFIYHGDSAREHDSTVKGKTADKSYHGKYDNFIIPASIAKHAKKIDAALANVKVCDPAIGSGAFPVGMMHEIVRARLTLVEARLVKETEKTNAYEYKRRVIQQSIYGVDIEESAIEIAKLRLWLSLVVDETDVDDIKPLPNLRYKIVKGNSLLGIDRWDLFQSESLRRFEELKDLHFDETNKNKKRQYEREIDNIIKSFSSEGKFDFEVFFSEVFRKNKGFDIVIGNPPYVRHEAIKDIKPALKKAFGDFFKGTADLYTYFYKKGIDLLKTGGHLAYITPNKFMTAAYGDRTRNLLTTEAYPLTLIDFGEFPVFEAATLPCVFLGKKSNSKHEAVFQALPEKELRKGEWTDPAYAMKKFGFNQLVNTLSTNSWRIEKPQILNLINKIISKGSSLNSYQSHKINYGLKTGRNEGFVINKETYEKIVLEDPSSMDCIDPWLRGRDIHKWFEDNKNFYVINIRSSSIVSWPWTGKPAAQAEEVFASTYPILHAYLTQDAENLRKIKKRTDQGQYWWELRSCAYHDEFLSPKIIWAEMGQHLKFFHDTKGYFGETTIFILPSSDFFLVGFLGTTTANFYLNKTLSSIYGGTKRYKANYMQHLPIPHASEDQKKEIAFLAQQITDLKAVKPDADVSSLEQQINEKVYVLFDLTPDEIAIIEGNDDE